MKRFFSLVTTVALLSLLSFADINVRASGPYIDLARGANWSGSGVGGFNNTYIFSPQSAEQGVCVYVYNNDAVNGYTPNFIVFQTGDQSVNTYTGNTSKWIQLLATGTLSIPASGSVQFFFKTTGAASVAIQSGGGAVNTGTVDLLAVQTQQGCGQRVNTPASCTNTKSVSVATATTGVILANTGSPTSIHVCSYQLLIGGPAAAVTTSTGAFKQGTGAACGTGTVTIFSFPNGNGTAQQFTMPAGYGEIFEVGPSINLCYTDGGTTNGTMVNITYSLY